MVLGLASGTGLHPPGELGRQQREPVAQLNARFLGKISWPSEQAAARGRKMCQRDAGGDRDVEALGESGHRNAERAGAGRESLGRWTLVLVAEQQGRGTVGGQFAVEPRRSIEMPCPDPQGPLAEPPRGPYAAPVRPRAGPLV